MRTAWRIERREEISTLVKRFLRVLPDVKSIKVYNPSFTRIEVEIDSKPFDFYSIRDKLRKDIFSQNPEIIFIEATKEEWEKLYEIEATKELSRKLRKGRN